MGKFCFSPGCKVGYSKDSQERKIKNLPSISLFKVPKDPALFEIWKRSIPRADRELRPTDHVCGRHFKQEDIETFFETKIFDGSIFRIRRGRPKLNPSAIPCLFPDVPGHSSYIPKELQKLETSMKMEKETEPTTTPPSSLPLKKKQKKSGNLKTSLSEKNTKQKKDSSIELGKENVLFEGIVVHPVLLDPPLVQSISLKDVEREIDSIPPPLQNCSISDSESFPTVDCNEEYCISSLSEDILGDSNAILSKSVIEEQFTFNFLKVNVNMIDTMNSWWKINVLEDFISFIRWMPDYTVERKIVITKDLAVKVFLKDKETSIGHDLEVLSIDVISRLIFRVERTQICSGILKKERNCDGFLQGVFLCKKYNLCLSCIKWEKEQKKLQMKPVKLPRNLVELIRFNLNE